MVTAEAIIKNLNENMTEELALSNPHQYYDVNDFQNISNALARNVSVKKCFISLKNANLGSKEQENIRKEKITKFLKVLEALKDNHNLTTVEIDLHADSRNSYDFSIIDTVLSNPIMKSLIITLRGDSNSAATALRSLKTNNTLEALTINGFNIHEVNEKYRDHIESEVLESLAYGLAQNISLREFNFNGDISLPVVAALKNNKRITEFNHFGGAAKDDDTFIELTEMIRHNKSLKKINLSGDYIGFCPYNPIQPYGQQNNKKKDSEVIPAQDRKIIALASALKTNTNLEAVTLNLSATDVGNRALVDALKDKKIPVNLKLSIVGGGFHPIALSLATDIAIVQLELSYFSVSRVALDGDSLLCAVKLKFTRSISGIAL